MYFEAVKLLLSRFSDWENCDMYNYISNSSDWENCLTDAAPIPSAAGFVWVDDSYRTSVLSAVS